MDRRPHYRPRSGAAESCWYFITKTLKYSLVKLSDSCSLKKSIFTTLLDVNLSPSGTIRAGIGRAHEVSSYLGQLPGEDCLVLDASVSQDLPILRGVDDVAVQVQLHLDIVRTDFVPLQDLSPKRGERLVGVRPNVDLVALLPPAGSGSSLLGGESEHESDLLPAGRAVERNHGALFDEVGITLHHVLVQYLREENA